jgi:hypothetical protein
MKVICLFNSISGGTTKYKIYDVIKESNIFGVPVYYINKDNGSKNWIVKSFFVTLEDNREKKLEKLWL